MRYFSKGSNCPEEASKVTDKVAEDENILVTNRDIFLIVLPPHFRSEPGNVLRSSLKETWAEDVTLIPWEIVYFPALAKRQLSLRKRIA